MNKESAANPSYQIKRTKTVSKSRRVVRTTRKQPQASPLVRKAITLMIWEGHHRDDAAKSVGILPKSLYNAMKKHHVRRFYREQLEVLRTTEKAKNIHALARIRDQDENKMAVVAAVKALEQMDDDDMLPAPGSAPGLVVVVEAAPRPCAPAPVIGIMPSTERE